MNFLESKQLNKKNSKNNVRIRFVDTESESDVLKWLSDLKNSKSQIIYKSFEGRRFQLV